MATIPTAQANILSTDIPNADTGGALRLDLRTAPRANAEDFAPPANSFVNPGLMDAGLNRASEVLGQIQSRDDSLWAQDQGLKSRSYWMQKFKDPSYQPTPEQFQSDYTDYQNNITQNAPSGRAADMLMMQTNEHALGLFGETLDMQTRKAQAARMATTASIANQTVDQATDMPPGADAINFVNNNLGQAGVHKSDKSGAVGAVYGSWAQNNPKGILAIADPSGKPIELPGMNFKQSQAVIDKATVNAATTDMQGTTPDEMQAVIQKYGATASPSVVKALTKSTNTAFSQMANDPVAYFSGRPEIQEGNQALQLMAKQTNDPSAITDSNNNLLEMNVNAQQQARYEMPKLFMNQPIKIYSNAKSQDIVSRVQSTDDPNSQMQALNQAKQIGGKYWDSYGVSQLEKDGLSPSALFAMQATDPATASLLLRSSTKEAQDDVKDSKIFSDGMKSKVDNAFGATPASSALLDIYTADPNSDTSYQRAKGAIVKMAQLDGAGFRADPTQSIQNASNRFMNSIFGKVDTLAGQNLYVPKTLGFSPADLSGIGYQLNAEKSQLLDAQKQSGVGLMGDAVNAHNVNTENLGISQWVKAPTNYLPMGSNPNDYVALMSKPDGATPVYVHQNGQPVLRSLTQMRDDHNKLSWITRTLEATPKFITDSLPSIPD